MQQLRIEVADIGLHLHLAAYLYIIGCSQISLGSLDLSQLFWVYYNDTISLCCKDIRILINPGLVLLGWGLMVQGL